jgi:hypothetical protein
MVSRLANPSTNTAHCSAFHSCCGDNMLQQDCFCSRSLLRHDGEQAGLKLLMQQLQLKHQRVS